MSSGQFLRIQFSSGSSLSSVISGSQFAALMTSVPNTAPVYYLTRACPGPATVSLSEYTSVVLPAVLAGSNVDCAVVVYSGNASTYVNAQLVVEPELLAAGNLSESFVLADSCGQSNVGLAELQYPVAVQALPSR